MRNASPSKQKTRPNIQKLQQNITLIKWNRSKDLLLLYLLCYRKLLSVFILLICSSKEKKKPLPLTNNQVLKKKKTEYKGWRKRRKGRRRKKINKSLKWTKWLSSLSSFDLFNWWSNATNIDGQYLIGYEPQMTVKCQWFGKDNQEQGLKRISKSSGQLFKLSTGQLADWPTITIPSYLLWVGQYVSMSVFQLVNG